MRQPDEVKAVDAQCILRLVVYMGLTHEYSQSIIPDISPREVPLEGCVHSGQAMCPGVDGYQVVLQPQVWVIELRIATSAPTCLQTYKKNDSVQMLGRKTIVGNKGLIDSACELRGVEMRTCRLMAGKEPRAGTVMYRGILYG